ncbi:MAG: hypothetical protein KAG86_07685 [Gammaproteobacteria bacterium]|nr:hypothetical protein [Gammaproteobacteria bacterium]
MLYLFKKKRIRIENPLDQVKIPNHTYSATLICLLLQLVIEASISLRGSEKALTIFNRFFNESLGRVPSWLSVRSWLLRLGYYKLMQAKAIANDWCWIADHTIQLGTTKCLLILGLRLSDLPPEGESLRYEHLEPIDLFPVETSNGEIVWQQLETAALKTGVPRVIVSDYGSDLKSGIEKFCESHNPCTSIYDIKHKTACLLKGILEKDSAWEDFRKQAAQTKNQLQQTALSHLKAPNQRSKSRYMNADILLDWGNKTLQLLNSDIEFSEAEKEKLPKLDWLKAQDENLKQWTEHLEVITLAEQWVRKKGIIREGGEALKECYQQALPELHHANSIFLKESLIDFVKTQGSACNYGGKQLGSSEIIESVFGKQKYLERNYAKEGFSSLILGIGALVGKITVDTVKEALSSTPVKIVTKWCKDELGETLQSKKIKAYSEIDKGIKIGSSFCCDNLGF